MAQNQNLFISIALAIVIIVAIGAYAYTTVYNQPDREKATSDDKQNPDHGNTDNEIQLTIMYQGINYTYTLSAIEQIESITGSGRYIKTKLLPDSVVLSDIHNYTGITIEQLIEETNISSEWDQINVTASDGWTTMYSMNETLGNVDVYDTNGNITENGTATMIIAYKQDGTYYSLTDPEGDGPLRVAFIGEDTPITPSNLWTKKVVTIEIIDFT